MPMPESNCPGVETTRVVSQQSTASDQFEQVVAGADQRPLAVDLFQAPQQELPETPALLDLAEDRLHAQVMGLVNYLRRVVTGVGGYFPVELHRRCRIVSCIIAAACCLSEGRLVARAATMT